jgi:hypothetical protein
MFVDRARLVARISVALLPAVGVARLPAQSLPLKRAPQPTTAAISPADLMTRVYIFADDSMMGREVGTPNHIKATAYLDREVRRIGLTPAGDSGTFFQNLPIVNRALAPGSSLTVEDKKFAGGADYLPRDNSVFGRVRSLDGVTAVYGGVFSPQGDTSKMVTQAAAAGKLVVIGVPNGPDGKPLWGGNRQPLSGYYISAAGVAVVSLDAVDQATRGQLLEPTQLVKTEQSDPLDVPQFMYVSNAMAEALIGKSLSGLTRGEIGKTVRGNVVYAETPAPGRNVVAILPGSDPALKGQYVAVGAHNDHVGFNRQPVDHDSLRAFNSVVRPKGEDDPMRPATAAEAGRIKHMLDSLRKIRPARRDSIYNGADDDGSGSMALLEIAEALATSPAKPKRSILFVWHAGEEKGLWGAEYFTDHPTVPRDSIVAQLNIDMIGRGATGDIEGGGPGYVQLIGSKRLSTELGEIVEAVGKTEPTPFRFDYQFDANGHPQQYYCRSDHYEYARYGIPVAFFSTGGHRDYHQVTDEPQYIDYDQLARVATLVQNVALRVANLDHRIVVDKPKPDPRGQCVQ